MLRKFILPFALSAAAFAAVAGSPNAQAQVFPNVDAYLSAPNTQYAPSSISGTVSETFSSLTAGTKHTGTYSSVIGTYRTAPAPATTSPSVHKAGRLPRSR